MTTTATSMKTWKTNSVLLRNAKFTAIPSSENIIKASSESNQSIVVPGPVVPCVYGGIKCIKMHWRVHSWSICFNVLVMSLTHTVSDMLYLHAFLCQCQMWINIAHSRKISNVLDTLVLQKIKMSSAIVCNCPQNTPDPTCLQAESSRQSDQQQKMPDVRRYWAGIVVQRPHDCWQNIDVGGKCREKLWSSL